MSFSQLRLSVLFCALFSLLLCMSAEARVSVIVSVAPPAQEMIVEPVGYTSCYMIGPGFYNGIWVNQHRVCEYGSGGVWVGGYWQCGSYRHNGVCTHWLWAGSHWAGRHDAEYRRPWRHGYDVHESRYHDGHHHH